MHLLTVIDGCASILLLLCAVGWEASMVLIIRQGKVDGSPNGGETAVPLWSGVWGILWGLAEVSRWYNLVMAGELPSAFGTSLRGAASIAAAFTVARLSFLWPYLATLLMEWRKAGLKK